MGIATTAEEPNTDRSRTSLTVHDLSSNSPATSAGSDDRRIAGQQQTYSSFYQSALASATMESAEYHQIPMMIMMLLLLRRRLYLLRLVHALFITAMILGDRYYQQQHEELIK